MDNKNNNLEDMNLTESYEKHVEQLGGVVIKVNPTPTSYINPLDIDVTEAIVLH